MLILWKADFDGSDKELEQVTGKLEELADDHGFGVDGPYLPQDAALLYLFEGTLDDLSASGREFLPWVEEQGIDLTPLRYEIAQTPDEFWGT